MKKGSFTGFLLLAVLCLQAQNVGINNPTPPFPLSFNGQLGDKISLWNDGTSTHYGMGIQSGLLQVFSKSAIDNLAFGFGSSTAFTERMRVINSGEMGMQLNGRMVLRNGTSPLNNNFSPGIWLTKPDNSAMMGFLGVQNNQNMGFYSATAGWGFTYDVLNNRVGIGNNDPNAPLSFAPVLGKKITLYPGNTGDAGFGISPNRLQVFSDNPNADVAIGYDAAGTFNERFAFKPNGALAVNGNLGAAGMVLSSNGVNAVSWTQVKPAFYSYKQTDVQLPMPSNSNSPGEPQGWYVMGGLHNQSFTLNQISTVKLSLKLPVNNSGNTFGGTGTCAVYLGLYDASSNYIEYEISYLYVPDATIMDVIAFNLRTNLPSGTYRSHVKLRRFGGDELSTGTYFTGFDKGTLLVEVFPQ